MKTKAFQMGGKIVALFIILFYFGRLQAQLPVKEDDRTTVTYSGMQNDHLVFLVTIDNPRREKMQCNLTDEAQQVLFSETFFQQRFEKKFLLLPGEVKDISFIVNSKTYSFSRNYSISSKVVEEIIVKELK